MIKQVNGSTSSHCVVKPIGAAVSLAMAVLLSIPVSGARADTEPSTPVVFQAAGPDAESIQSTVDAFRAALGEPNNGNEPGPIAAGRREINWDGGGGVDTTTPPVTPFDVFLDARGAQFSTPGTGLTQAPPSGGVEGGLAMLFNNPSYATTFGTFSPLRLFSPVDSNLTVARFFIPGSNGGTPANVSGFGAVFTDVDRLAGVLPTTRRPTQIAFFDEEGRRLIRLTVPGSAGDASLSFLGVVFDEARIATVRITTGSVPPGPDDDLQHDIVVMDDFIYGEPRLPSGSE